MKALLSKAPGGPQTLELEELPEPRPGGGEAIAQLAARGALGKLVVALD